MSTPVSVARRAELAHAAPRLLRVIGPAFVVSIGYMDPGNWATDLAAGAYGGALLGVVALAGALAVVLQILAVRLGAATRKDLATLIAERWPRAARSFWAIAFGSAVATDLAEFTGIAIGLHLLFGLALAPSALVAATLLAVFFGVVGRRVRRIEIALMISVAAIALGYCVQIFLAHPDWATLLHQAFAPLPLEREAIVVAVGIVGATVMPHNLFLHSALIARRSRDGKVDTAQLTRTYALETVVALVAATLVNGAILVVGVHLHAPGGSIDAAYSELIRGTSRFAAVVFGLALVVSGFASATSATLAGDIIFRGFGFGTLSANARRTATLMPAVVAVLAGANPDRLLLWSQVVLALALPVVLVPLVRFTCDPTLMGRFANPRSLRAAAFSAAAICALFDVGLLASMRF
ncbi:MAG: Nramp family divalent metal transporter [Vulcanimicrobiaceae bacterium]